MVHQIINEATLKSEPKRSNTPETKIFDFLNNFHNKANCLRHETFTAIEVVRKNALMIELERNRAAYFLQRTAHAP